MEESGAINFFILWALWVETWIRNSMHIHMREHVWAPSNLNQIHISRPFLRNISYSRWKCTYRDIREKLSWVTNSNSIRIRIHQKIVGNSKCIYSPAHVNAIPNCHSRVRWKIANDLRFPNRSFCGIAVDLALAMPNGWRLWLCNLGAIKIGAIKISSAVLRGRNATKI